MHSSKKPYLRYANLTITFRELPTHSAVCFLREAGESSGIIPEEYAISVETDREDKETTSYLEKRTVSRPAGAQFSIPKLLHKQRGDLSLILPTDHVPGIPDRRKRLLQERCVITV